MNLVALKTELTNDPLGRGYAGMGDVLAAVRLNVIDRTQPVVSISTADLYDAIAPAEYTSLTATQKAILSDIFALSEVRVQGNTRTTLLAIFGPGSETRTALISLATKPGSRSDELALGGTVTPSHVADARRLS